MLCGCVLHYIAIANTNRRWSQVVRKVLAVGVLGYVYMTDLAVKYRICRYYESKSARINSALSGIYSSHFYFKKVQNLKYTRFQVDKNILIRQLSSILRL